MKNSSMLTALAAFVAFVGAAVYAMLFSMEILPSGILFAITGIAVAIIVLILLTFSAAYCGCKAKHCLHNSLACFGKVLIFAAVVTLCVSVLLLVLPVTVTPFYSAVLFLTIFFWKFLLILWGLSLAVTIPCFCYIDQTDCSTANTSAAADTNCANNYSTGTNNTYSNSGYSKNRYNY